MLETKSMNPYTYSGKHLSSARKQASASQSSVWSFVQSVFTSNISAVTAIAFILFAATSVGAITMVAQTEISGSTDGIFAGVFNSAQAATPRVLGMATYGYNQPVCQRNTSNCINYQLVGFSGNGWKVQIDYNLQSNLTGAIRVNTWPFMDNITGNGEGFTGYDLLPNNTYTFILYRKFGSRLQQLTSVAITAPDRPAQYVRQVCTTPAPAGCYYQPSTSQNYSSNACGYLVCTPQPAYGYQTADTGPMPTQSWREGWIEQAFYVNSYAPGGVKVMGWAYDAGNSLNINNISITLRDSNTGNIYQPTGSLVNGSTRNDVQNYINGKLGITAGNAANIYTFTYEFDNLPVGNYYVYNARYDGYLFNLSAAQPNIITNQPSYGYTNPPQPVVVPIVITPVTSTYNIATVGQFYSNSFSATPANANYTITSDSNLPPGLSLHEPPVSQIVCPYNGSCPIYYRNSYILSGAPTTAGVYTFTLKAVDSTSGNVGVNSFTITVYPALPGVVSARVGQLVYKSNKTVYLIGQNGLYGIPTVGVFNSWGWSFSQVLPANSAEEAMVQIGIVPSRDPACSDPLSQIAGTCGTAKTVLTSISPSQGAPGQTVTIKFYGSGLSSTANQSGNGLVTSLGGLLLQSSKLVSDSELDGTYLISSTAPAGAVYLGVMGSNAMAFTIIATPSVLNTPTLSVASPVSQYVIGGTQNAPVAVFRFTPSAAITIQQLTFSSVGNAITGVTVGGVTSPVVGGTSTISGLNITVPANYGMDVPVSVNFAQVGVNGISSPAPVLLTLTNVQYSAGGQTQNLSANVSSNTMSLVGSYPSVSLVSPTGGSSGNGSTVMVMVAKVTVSANPGGNIVLHQLPLSITSPGGVFYGNVSVMDDAIGQTVNVGSPSFGPNNFSFNLTFNSDNTIAAGSSKTYDIYITSAIPSGNITVVTQLGSLNNFMFADVNGGAQGLTGAYIPSYPTNTVSVQVAGQPTPVNPSAATLTVVPVSVSNSVAVGSSSFLVAQYNITASNNNVSVSYVGLTLSGSASASTFANYKLFVNGNQVGSTWNSSLLGGNVLPFTLSSPFIVPVGQTAQLQVFADVVSGAGTSFNFGLADKFAINALDTGYKATFPITANSFPVQQSGPISIVSAVPATTIRVGAIINNNGTVQLVGQNGLYGFPNIATFNSWGFTFSSLVMANGAEKALSQIGVVPMKLPGCNAPLDQIAGTCGNPPPTTGPRIGSIINKNGTVYLVGSAGLYGFPDLATFNSWGFTFSSVITANTAESGMSMIGLVPAKSASCSSPLAQIAGTCGAATLPPPVVVTPPPATTTSPALAVALNPAATGLGGVASFGGWPKVASYLFTAGNAPVTVTGIGLQPLSTSCSGCFTGLKAMVGSTQIGMTFSNTALNTSYSFVPSGGLVIPANSSVVLDVYMSEISQYVQVYMPMVTMPGVNATVNGGPIIFYPGLNGQTVSITMGQ